jgi:hypothetical protein
MSGEDGPDSPLELTRRVFERASAHDYDAMMEPFGPDSVWDASPWALGAHTGVPAIRRFIERWIGSFDEWKITPLMMLDLGNGIVFAPAIQTGRTAGSPQPFRMQQASVFVWRGSTLARVTHYRDVEVARMEANRLAEEANRPAEDATPAPASSEHSAGQSSPRA